MPLELLITRRTILSHISRRICYLCRLMLSEQKVQTKRIKELESQGYYVIKLIKTNKNGIPDIIALHPEKGVLFSEIKRADGKLSPLQKYRIEELKQKGFNVEVHYGTND